MASYFTKFPKVFYNKKIITDILTRITVTEKYSDRLSVYYPYHLQEGDTPEIVASKYYGDPEKHWLVLLFNNITDPFFDFPISANEFEKYLDKKYATEGAVISRTGSEYAKLTVNTDPIGYKAIITTTDNNTGVSTTEEFYIDEKAYLGQYADASFNYADMTTQVGDITYTQTTQAITIYDYESDLNEQKREIKLLRKDYVNQVETELKYLLRVTYE